jgi:hypothetical protein
VPFTTSGGIIHFISVCSGTPDANGLLECSGTFSGAASDQWAAFGSGSTAHVGESSGGGIRYLAQATVS